MSYQAHVEQNEMFTHTENKTLADLANGLTRAAMAEHQHRSINTIDFRLRQMYQKAGGGERSAAFDVVCIQRDSDC